MLKLLLSILPLAAFAQSTNWHHLDPEIDGVLGISTKRAYEYLGSRHADTVIVAIIDNGVELTHEDLQGVFWINPNEIPNNGLDDDGNGYIDDVNGWNFLGNSKGENLKRETTGLTRVYGQLKSKYQGKTKENITVEDTSEFKKYLEVKHEYEERLKSKKEEIEYFEKILQYYLVADKIIKETLKKDTYSEIDLQSITKKGKEISAAKDFMLQVFERNLTKNEIEKRIKNLKADIETRLNTDFKNRENIVGDDPDNINDTIYGNNMLNVKGPYHGTEVASIVGALNNGIGVDGIAKNVSLMIIRIVPNGDERDKDIALAFRYAVRNGADIISCSFAKKYSLHHDFVQKAIEEAEEKGVLIVNAAGNNGTNNDEIAYYPTGVKTTGEIANNYITVGASREKDNKDVVAFFSNYGQTSVDIFAPGYNIEACILNNGYGSSSGTSISAPVVAGMAAVIKSYYPNLTAQQLKEIIIKSSFKPQTKEVIKPGQDKESYIAFENLCVSGGIANLYRAILLAENEYKK